MFFYLIHNNKPKTPHTTKGRKAWNYHPIDDNITTIKDNKKKKILATNNNSLLCNSLLLLTSDQFSNFGTYRYQYVRQFEYWNLKMTYLKKLQKTFTWNKKQMKANKFSIFLMYTFKIVSPINLSKFVSISQIFLKLGHFRSFLHCFSQMWLGWAVLWVFQRIRNNSYSFHEKVTIR